jgi:hypothetical protein
MIEPDAYLPGESPDLEYVYNNESEEEPVYWPIYFTQLKYPKDARRLYNDDEEDYIAYSGGWNTLFVTKQKDGRYKNISVRAVSGDSFGFYLSAGLLSDGIPTYFSGPATTSGNYSVLTEYLDEEDARTNRIFFTSPADNAQVYTFPKVNVVNFMRLHHSGESYRLYQFLPRTLIQVDDLEADVIDAVTIRVSDSIVVTADDLADGSITGAKILAGTVSGVLITPGTITSNLIQAQAITADKLDVAELSAVATKTGSLEVSNVITVTSGEIDAGFTRITQQGITVGSFSESLPVVNRLNILGSGTINDVVGLAMYNASFSTTNPLLNIKLDSVNAVKFENNQSSGGVINFDFPENSTSTSVNIFNGDLNLRRSPATPTNVAPGAIYGYDSDSTNIWELSANRLYLASVTGDRVFEFRTDTGNLDLFGGDFFMYNSAETGIVASISKTGVAEFTASIESPTFYVDSDGTASAPSISWSSDTDTGIYRISDGYVGITSNTVLSAGFFEGQIRATNGAVDAPAYSFINDTDSGIYRLAGGVAFSINNSLAAYITTNNVFAVNTTNQNGQITVEVPDGTARTALTLRQLNDASNLVNFVTNGVGATFPVQTSALGTYYGKVRVAVNGTTRWLALYNT